MDDPTTYLVEPGEPDDSATNGFANPLDAFNYLSPSAYLNTIIAELTGVDVFNWMADWVGGDWAALYKFGDAVGNLAQCLQQLGANVQEGAIAVDASWDGNASDAAYVYFSNLAAAVSGQQTALYDARDNYHKAAVGAWQLANQLGNILQALADKAILAGIAAAAGTDVRFRPGYEAMRRVRPCIVDGCGGVVERCHDQRGRTSRYGAAGRV